MTELKISPKFRGQLSEKLMDLGNLGLGALALGQFVTDRQFSPVLFLGGVTLFFTCYLVSYLISF